jgi:hypothetical protein
MRFTCRVPAFLAGAFLSAVLVAPHTTSAAEGDGLPGACVRPGAGPADPIVYEVEGEPTGIRPRPGHFGWVLAQLDDLDGDGMPEFAAGAHSFVLPDGRFGFVALFSGRTGQRLRHWLPPPDRDYFGLAVAAAGDADGDGFRDLAVMDATGAFDVLSTSSGERLFAVPRPRGDFGGVSEFLVPLGDVDGDGVGDIAFSVGSYDDAAGEPERPTFEVGRVAAHSGADGRLLWERLGEEDSLFGFRSVSVEDVSADGVPDLLVGQPYSSVQRQHGIQSPPARLVLLSGSDGTVLATHVGQPWQGALGRGLAFLGDTDANGRVEVAAAASLAYNGLKEEAGWVGVFELPSFALRFEIRGEHGADFYFAGDLLGFRTSEAGDTDGDGATDFLLSTFHVRTLSAGPVYGRLYLHSGRTGDLLQVYEGQQTPIGSHPSEPYVTALAPLGDVDGDGRDEFLVGAGGWALDDPLRGYVQLLRYQAELPPLRRGEVDGDGRYTITDVYRVARAVFGLAPVEPCPLLYDLDGNNRLDSLDILYLICNTFTCTTFTPPEPAPPSSRCGRYARLKPTRSEVPLSCTGHTSCSE